MAKQKNKNKNKKRRERTANLMVSNSRRPWRISIRVIPRVLSRIIWSLILHLLFLLFLLPLLLFFFLVFNIPWVKGAIRGTVRGIWLLRVRRLWSVGLQAWLRGSSPSLAPDGGVHECSSCCILNIFFSLQRSSFESSCSLSLQLKEATSSGMKT